MAYAATYRVGDEDGWTFSVQDWPNGKHFMAGDILVFNYGAEVHNVVEVNQWAYENCDDSKIRGRKHTTGNDHIQLVKGMNYFLCSHPDHCSKGGMRIAVNAA
ncbi:hypothetical protein PIB30_064335 [Stylosanthes scabra]|uniref:Phytocyanin domain-containing protein n=1 Tax=Stylosanthes scabra TaxID=79078 RepID=A0ABU6XLU8_9FABA|nr:hypothetical protein [Stylosanthes scabra]